MKLARVDHRRCDDYAGTTLVWVEDDMTEDQFQEAVDRALDAYLKTVSESMKEEKSPYHLPIDWENNRARVVGEVLDEQAAKKKKHDAWEKKRQKARASFDTFLAEEEGIKLFWQHEFELEGEAYWGHRHGQSIEYGETEWPSFKLLKLTQKAVDGGKVRKIVREDEWA